VFKKYKKSSTYCFFSYLCKRHHTQRKNMKARIKYAIIVFVLLLQCSSSLAVVRHKWLLDLGYHQGIFNDNSLSKSGAWISCTQGISFNPHLFLGAGTSLSCLFQYPDYVIIPVHIYLEGRYHFKAGSSPFIGSRFGCVVNGDVYFFLHPRSRIQSPLVCGSRYWFRIVS